MFHLSDPFLERHIVTSRGVLSRLRQLPGSDRGIGLAEVVVALMVFAIVATGMLYSIAAIQRMTRESASRETATNLAAAEIDKIQAVSDAFNVHSGSRVVPGPDGVNYTVETIAGWVSTNGSTGNCGSGGGNLQYKAVNVEVELGRHVPLDPGARGLRDGAGQPHQRPELRHDPDLGPRLRRNGPVGRDGPRDQGVRRRRRDITDPIDATDADGCTYVLKVSPGKYKIEVESRIASTSSRWVFRRTPSRSSPRVRPPLRRSRTRTPAPSR